ncbi:galactose oxidase kelch beta-propeller [Stemphylium lycopersici]|uniref:Galactose oxidase kelch beta-propeller n=1 Tax=Stemphylium lycopersici TaxID=183478 RepID=A0A364N644_STELY|nr:galactose oxidase kelch beta-propeller [Stemphylium lycopersici]
MAFEIRIRRMLVLLHISLLSTVAAQMPYNPTRILQSNDTLYAFRPSSKSSTQFQLSTIDISSTVEASDLPYNTLYSTLPFLDDNNSRPFTPVLDNGGGLTVYTGDCALGASGVEIWSYTPDSNGRGSWSKQNVSVVDSSHASIMGPNYLNDGISFSSVVGGDAAIAGAYFFGGMCPNASDTTSDWQSAANYSNFMVTLEPSEATDEDISYDMDVSSSRGPPIPEAGFTITGLLPTFSDRKDGTQIQQQNFVLIGGHTSTAFINMSQIALFSLPEQGWTFTGVQQPDTTRTDLAIRADISTIDPRSGHTAVLSPDGQRILVFGGWVGDIDTPAEPQFAVLSVADGYGGNGDWQWIVPSTTGAGPPNESALYGHGAVMLPGGVLMISGGFSIPTSDTRRRRDTPNANTQTYFLNVTSMAWTTEYVPQTEMTSSEPADYGLLSTTGQKAGLGVGIGIGLAVIGGLFALYVWYRRRSKEQRELREKQLQNLSYTAHRYNAECYGPGSVDRGGRSDTLDYLVDQNGPYYFPSGTQGGQGWKATNRGDVERTGLLVEIPSPTRGLRRNLSGRPAYATGRPRGSSGIHPIDELEEETDEEQIHDNYTPTRHPEMTEARSKSGGTILDNAPVLDPFIDSQGNNNKLRVAANATPTANNHESSGHNRNRSHGRINLNLAGRISPEKSSSERTSSNLSERSTMSWASSNDGVVRSTSMRSANILNNMTGSSRSPDASPTSDKTKKSGEAGREAPEEPRTNSFNSIQSNGQPDLESFQTAQSSFAHLQAQGEALLGGNPERPRPDTGSSKSDTYRDTDRSNSRAATATPATSSALDLSSAPRSASKVRRMSWLGSVRRVLTRSVSSAERTRSMITPASYQEPYRDDPISPIEPSPPDNRKSFPAATAPPQRAASDASFWRNRRGKQDWLEDEQDPAWRRTAGDDWGAPEDIAMAERERQRQEWRERGNLLVNINSDERLPTPRTPIAADQLGVPSTEDRPSTPASEADWDVEAAVERRVVQVMFTVPKSKLRVVNADVDGASLMSVARDGDDNFAESSVAAGSSSRSSASPSRVKDLAGRFEQMNSGNSPRISPRPSPRPSPSNSIKSMKIRGRPSAASLARQQSLRSARRGSGPSPLGNGKEKVGE